jgi:hypothetical protein
MQNLLVSIMRFSTAVTLYSFEQIQSSMNIVQGGQDLNQVLDKFQGALDSLSDVFVANIGEKKKDTLKSITTMTEDLVRKSFDGMSILDPREVMKNTTDMIRDSSDSMAGWVSKVISTEGEEPKRAAEVLV